MGPLELLVASSFLPSPLSLCFVFFPFPPFSFFAFSLSDSNPPPPFFSSYSRPLALSVALEPSRFGARLLLSVFSRLRLLHLSLSVSSSLVVSSLVVACRLVIAESRLPLVRSRWSLRRCRPRRCCRPRASLQERGCGGKGGGGSDPATRTTRCDKEEHGACGIQRAGALAPMNYSGSR